MPEPPPRAPTFPAFIDQVKEIDDSDFVPNAAPTIPSTLPSESIPSPVVTMGDTSNAIGANSSTSTSAADAVPVVPLPVAQRKSRVRAVLLWRDPKVTGAIVAVDMVFFYLTLVRGSSILSVIGGLFFAYLALGLIVVNANKRMGGKLDKYVARPPASTPLFRRESAIRIADTVVEEGNEVAEEIRDIVYCDKPSITLAWMAFAFVVYILGKYFSLLSVFLVLTIAAFTVPLAYEKNKKTVDDALATASDTASRHLETGRRIATERAEQMREVAAERSAPLLEKAPPVARNFAEKMGLTPKKKAQ